MAEHIHVRGDLYGSGVTKGDTHVTVPEKVRGPEVREAVDRLVAAVTALSSEGTGRAQGPANRLRRETAGKKKHWSMAGIRTCLADVTRFAGSTEAVASAVAAVEKALHLH